MLRFQGKASRLFSSLFFLFFFLFFLEDFIGLFFLGNHNLLQVVNETRVGLHSKGVIQFLRLLQKIDVHSEWLAKCGRKRLKTKRLQLTIHLIMHGTNLASMELGNVSIFQLAS